jgi:hypothetical protein
LDKPTRDSLDSLYAAVVQRREHDMAILEIATPPRVLWLTCAVSLALALSPASADTTSFTFPTLATQSAGTAGTIISAQGISLPETGTPAFGMTFVLPRDYLNNGKVRIAMQLVSNNTPCTARFEPTFLSRIRAGRPYLGGSAGLTAANGSPTIFFPNQNIVAKVFSLVPDPAFPGQRGGDAFFVRFRRDADHVTDNCSGSLFVYSIEITYPRQLP